MSWVITGAPGTGDNLLYSQAGTPALDLRFASTKSLTDYVSGQNRVTFTRASSGTFVGSDGVLQTAAVDVPRFDHNPTTGESLGLLVEEPRANLCLQSEAFGTTWITTGTASITADQTASPTGATTADCLTVAAGGPNRVLQAGLAAISTTYTFSVFAKSDDINGVLVRAFFSGGTTIDTWANFIFSSKTFSNVNGAGVFAFQELKNGWFRVQITVASGNNTAWEFRIGGLIVDAQTGDKVFVWGAQLEAGSFPTSYIPTTTATVTRAADVASITGANFSSWYNQTEGTVFAETQLQSIAARTVAGFDINDNSTNNRIVFRALTASSADQTVIRSASSTVFSAANVSPAPTTASRKSAVGYKVNDFMFTAIGSAGYTGTTGAVPVSVNQMLIGYEQGPTGQLGGTLKRLTYWPTRLANPTLQAITQ
jgi:hypothetical protein